MNKPTNWILFLALMLLVGCATEKQPMELPFVTSSTCGVLAQEVGKRPIPLEKMVFEDSFLALSWNTDEETMRFTTKPEVIADFLTIAPALETWKKASDRDMLNEVLPFWTVTIQQGNACTQYAIPREDKGFLAMAQNPSEIYSHWGEMPISTQEHQEIWGFLRENNLVAEQYLGSIEQKGFLEFLQEANQVAILESQPDHAIECAIIATDAPTVESICTMVQQAAETGADSREPMLAPGGGNVYFCFCKDGKPLGGLNYAPPTSRTNLDDPKGAELTLWAGEIYWYILPTPGQRLALYRLREQAFGLAAQTFAS